MTTPCPACGAPRSTGTKLCARCAGRTPLALAKRIGIVVSLVIAIALTIAQLIWPRLDPQEAKALEAIQRCRSEANDPVFDPQNRKLAHVPCDMLAQQYTARYGRKP